MKALANSPAPAPAKPVPAARTAQPEARAKIESAARRARAETPPENPVTQRSYTRPNQQIDRFSIERVR